MMRMSSSRRGVLKGFAAIAAASGVPEWFLRRDAVLAAEATSVKPAATTQAKLPVALIGCGGRGQYVADHDGAKHVQVVAICDADAKQTAQAKEKFPQAEVYSDFRKVMERKDVKAVINATPDHWHTLVNLHAMRQGKDVYSEKPLTLTIEEGQHVVEEVKKTNRILQTGSQQRSDAKFRLACELVRNGRIGKLVHVSTTVPTGGAGGPFSTEQQVPEGLDWEMWQGQTQRHPFQAERIHGMFRWWWDYSEGTMTDWGAHHFDIVQWALGMDDSGPVSIDGHGIGDPVRGGWTTFPSFAIEFEYANGVTHSAIAIPQTTPPYATERLLSAEERKAWEESRKSKQKEKTWRNGVRFEGSDGWIEVARGRIEASHPELLKEPLPENATKLYHSDDHMGNFVRFVETREQPICPASVGHRSATVCHLGAISCRLDRKILWDPQKQEFKGDEAANAMRSRPMHEPWGYDQV